MKTNRDWRIESGGESARSVLNPPLSSERGCVVLDQPQRVMNQTRSHRSVLRLVFDTAALRDRGGFCRAATKQARVQRAIRMRSSAASSLRRSARRYLSQRDKFHLLSKRRGHSQTKFLRYLRQKFLL